MNLFKFVSFEDIKTDTKLICSVKNDSWKHTLFSRVHFPKIVQNSNECSKLTFHFSNICVNGMQADQKWSDTSRIENEYCFTSKASCSSSIGKQ